jgi:hypothetical protein
MLARASGIRGVDVSPTAEDDETGGSGSLTTGFQSVLPTSNPGGKANIVRVDACAETRLRLEVHYESRIREAELRKEGHCCCRQTGRADLAPPCRSQR